MSDIDDWEAALDEENNKVEENDNKKVKIEEKKPEKTCPVLPKKAKKKEKKRKVVIDINKEVELNDAEKLEIKNKIENDNKEHIEDLFGVKETDTNLENTALDSNQSFNIFATKVYKIVNNTDNKKFCVIFLNKLIQEFEKDLTIDQLNDIEDKLKVVINNKIKTERGNKGKKKKAPAIKVGGKSKLYDDYEDEDFKVDQNNFVDNNAYDDFM